MKLWLLSLVLMFVCLTGCEEVFINRGDLTKVHETVGILSTQLDAGQTLMTEIAMVTGKNIEETEAINKKIDEYQPVLVDAADAIAKAPTLIEGAIEANKVSAPVNPYAPIIDAVLKIIVGITATGGTVAVAKTAKIGKENRELKEENIENRNKYKAAKRGAEVLRMRHPEVAAESYELVGEERKKLGAI